MVDLIAQTPCVGLLPVAHGPWRLEEVEPGRLTWLSPFAGRTGLLDQILRDKHGLGWPAPGEGDARLFWCGKDQAMLLGPEPDPTLAEVAAVSDQTDGWAVVRLCGAGGHEVLARLVPVDLRPDSLPMGKVVRTLCQHMSVTILRESNEALLILGFRSMARTLVHEIGNAMVSVAAQRVPH
ncbi:sarcosine oxidase subunit gamma [Tropicibacter sp. S64]|uniref:sarcosine oxidase subunit gamma n=1 Tax=Tropicibacter sp. S64 TaxID=3415122 RepID=UPI003C7A04E4